MVNHRIVILASFFQKPLLRLFLCRGVINLTSPIGRSVPVLSIHTGECQVMAVCISLVNFHYLSPGTDSTFSSPPHRPAPPSTTLPHTLSRLPTLRNTIQLRSSNLLVVVTLSSFPAPAAPITPRDLPAFSEAPSLESSLMDHKATFGIVFVLGLFLLIEVGYACVGFRVRFTRFIEVGNSICDTSDIVMQRLSSFRVFKFIKKGR
ncbi:hypothetical protein EDB86DRAFT_2294642 [Lactarius hatsudake]|nr:hypothetical protein EDB86DRAFT_2294642 [Lactarius hatsudake]